MAPPKFKLTYFNSKGVVEPIRFMFAYKGVEYEDVRVEREDWPELKPNTPFGKLPTLEVDGHLLAESMAISRYVAKELGLHGKTNLESASIDMYLDAIMDCFTIVKAMMIEENPEKKKELTDKLFQESVPVCFGALEKSLKHNGGHYFVGKEITLADFFITYAFEVLKNIEPAPFDAFPLLQEHVARIHDIPAIKVWVEKRPKTER